MSRREAIIEQALAAVKSRRMMFRHIMNGKSKEFPEFLAITTFDHAGSSECLIGKCNLPKGFTLSYYTHDRKLEEQGELAYQCNNCEWFDTLESAYRALLVRKNGDGFTTSQELTVESMANDIADEVVEVIEDIDDQCIMETGGKNFSRISAIQMEVAADRLMADDSLLRMEMLLDVVRCRRELVAGGIAVKSGEWLDPPAGSTG